MIFYFGKVLAQDTIAAWTFPVSSPDSLMDQGLPMNDGRYLSCEFGTWDTPSYYELNIDYSSDGSMGTPDKCAEVTGLEAGADSICWIIKFKTEGYESLKLYSKQSSDANNPGPKDFKVQYKISGTSVYTDLSNGTVVCSNDWTTGVVDGIPLPPECENLSGKVTIRWMQTSNLDVNGNALLASGISRIDDIVITGVQMVGVNDKDLNDYVNLYPNPSQGSFIINNFKNISEIKIFNTLGKCVRVFETSYTESLNIDGLDQGFYFVNFVQEDNTTFTKKIIIK